MANKEVAPEDILDYRFGWRCLLPLSSTGQVVAAGLEQEEVDWIRQYCVSPAAGNSSSIGCLLAQDIVSLSDAQLLLQKHNPTWVAVWGGRKAVASLRQDLLRFSVIREYGLLPANSPRLLVPLLSPPNALAAMRLHKPGRFIARLALNLAVLLAKLGNMTLLRSRVLLLAAVNPDLLDSALQDAGFGALQPGDDVALYLGSLDDNRKTTVLPTGSLSGVIAKVADRPRPCTSLRNEFLSLKALASTSLAHKVPVAIHFSDDGNRAVLTQEYRERARVSGRRFEAEVLQFLRDLSEVGRHSMALSDYLAGYSSDLSGAASECVSRSVSNLLRHLALRASSGEVIYLHRTHGDFVRWNCSWTGKGFYVYDWEASSEQGLALGDAFYFVIASYLHLQQQPDASRALDEAISFACAVIKGTDLSGLNVEDYLALWLLQRLSDHAFYQELIVLLARKYAG